LQTDYVTVVEDRPIISVKYCHSVPAFHFWPKLTVPAAIAEHLVKTVSPLASTDHAQLDHATCLFAVTPPPQITNGGSAPSLCPSAT